MRFHNTRRALLSNNDGRHYGLIMPEGMVGEHYRHLVFTK